MSRPKGPPIVDISRKDVDGMLKRVESLLLPEDVALIKTVVGALDGLVKLIWNRRMTIRRLRGIIGPPSSAKPAEVPGEAKSPNPPPEAAAQGETGATAPSTDGTGRQSAADDKGTLPAGESSVDGVLAKPAETVEGEPKEKEKEKRKGHGRVPVSAYLAATHISVPHASLHAGDRCPDCERGNVYRVKDPSSFLRIFGQAPLSAISWDCEQLRCNACNRTHTARAPDEAQGPKYDETAVSMIAVQHYGTGTPFHRLEKLQRNLDTPVPASTQWEVVAEPVPVFLPVHGELERLAAQAPVLHNDDSHMAILAFLGKRRDKLLAQNKLTDPERTGLFTSAIIAIAGEGRTIALFYTGRQHAGENLEDLLSRRDPNLPPPIQMGDALTRNVPKEREVVESNCLAHGFRKIRDEIDNYPVECRYVLERLALVYEVDERCKDEKVSDQERLIRHQRESGPAMDEIRRSMKEELDQKRIEPNSGMGEAFNYLLKRWDNFTVFLRVPGAPLDNNICERALKMAIKHRNASLFYRNARGAQVGDVYMSLIHTAELSGINPFDYLTALQRHAKAVGEKPADWLPWNYQDTLARMGSRRPAAVPRAPHSPAITQPQAA